MSIYKGTNGKPRWQSVSGDESTRQKNRRMSLVKHGRASYYMPYGTVEEAIRMAGL
jgi:hypothetical protein